MKPFSRALKYVIVMSVLFPACAFAQMANLYNNLYWDAYGTHTDQNFGYKGLDYLASINDSIPHALSISSRDLQTNGNEANYVYNRFPLDTLRRFTFPGQEVHRCNLNGDAYPDFVCWSEANRNITFLMGTEKPDSFKIARILPGNLGHDEFDIVSIAAADFELSGHDDVIISDYAYGDNHGHTYGRLLFFRGGDTISAYANDSLYGVPGTPIGWQLRVGRIHDKKGSFLVEARGVVDTNDVEMFFYPFRDPFRFETNDSVTLHSHSVVGEDGGYTFGFTVCDVNGDSIDDFLFGHTNRIDWYAGGDVISPEPLGYFTKPSKTGSATFGATLIDVYDIGGHGYPSLLVTDPQGDLAGGMEGGTVFVFNMGKALKDSCVAYASRNDFESYWGTQASAVGDVSGDGLADFMIGGSADNFTGYVSLFKGSPSYGPLLGVHEPRTIAVAFRLDQNFPNPVSDETRITFAVADRALNGSEVTVKLFDVLGKNVATLYRGTTDGFGYTLRFAVSDLPTGTYVYRLSCGGTQIARTMNVLH